MIFQDLDAGLNPQMRVRDILREALTVHERPGDAEIASRIRELLEQVSLKDSKLANFPSELSGGEKRRVGIARVLAVRPRLIVADEPTSALDISIQAQVVNLLRDLQKNLGLTYLFISHDLPVVELVSQKVAVMYLGRIVEMGLAERIAHQPRHPYTGILWSSLADQLELLRDWISAGVAEGVDPDDRIRAVVLPVLVEHRIFLDLAALVAGLHRAEHAAALGDRLELLQHRLLDEIGQGLDDERALVRILVLSQSPFPVDDELDRHGAAHRLLGRRSDRLIVRV